VRVKCPTQEHNTKTQAGQGSNQDRSILSQATP